MRFPAQGSLFFVLLYLCAVPTGLAQNRQPAEKRVSASLQQKPAAARLLVPNEGLAILGAALDSRHHRADYSADCSHFVHGLYERAGFPFQYASSSDLYDGTDEFRRVTNPQAGDLIVWHGHAGIVVNPAQHSFFSVLHSGPGVDSYDSLYWKQRGRPRFYRYLKTAPGSGVNTSIRTASWTPTSTNNAESDEPSITEDASDEAAPPARFADKPAEAKPAISEIPDTVVVTSARPKAEQLSAAFLQACTNAQESLRRLDLFKSLQSVIVFDHFEVKKVHAAGNQGWVEVQIDELVSLNGSKAEAQRRSERQRWPLIRRDRTTWELTSPRDTIYVPQGIGARILAHELAQLTDAGPDTNVTIQEKAELARLLEVLLPATAANARTARPSR
jgi:hypothetical protein